MTQHEPNTQGASWEGGKITAANIAELFNDVEYDPKSYIQFTLGELADLLSKERAEGERRGAEKAVEYIRKNVQYLMTPDGKFEFDRQVLKDALTLPADSTEEKCAKTYCECIEHWSKPNRCVDGDCVCDTHDSTEGV